MKLTFKVQKLDSPTKETCKKPLSNNQRVNIFIEPQPPRLSRTSSSSPVKLTAYQFKHRPHPAPLGKSVQIKNYKFTTYSATNRHESIPGSVAAFRLSSASLQLLESRQAVSSRSEKKNAAKQKGTILARGGNLSASFSC